MAVFERFCTLLSSELERHGFDSDLRRYEFKRTYSKRASDLKWVMTSKSGPDIVSHIAIRDLVKCHVLHIVAEKGKLIVFREQLTINTVPSGNRLDKLEAKVLELEAKTTLPEHIHPVLDLLKEFIDIVRNGEPVK